MIKSLIQQLRAWYDNISIQLFKRRVRIMRQEGKLDQFPLEKNAPEKESLQAFLSWIVSEEGRRETDLDFIFDLTEVLLQKIVDGEIALEDINEMFSSKTPFRDSRMTGLIDEELVAKLEAAVPGFAEVASAEPETNVQKKKEGVLKQAIAIIQDLFKSEVNSQKEIELKKKKYAQWLLEKERLDKIKKAVLANSPEFLEQLGSDEYETTWDKALHAGGILAEEHKKLRSKIIEDKDLKILLPKEKSAKELAQEKLKLFKQLRKDLGTHFSSSS